MTAAAAQSPYPTDAVLHELAKTCFTRSAKSPGSPGFVAESIESWKKSALANGWLPLPDGTFLNSANDQAARYGIEALNHSLFGNFARSGRKGPSDVPLLGGDIFKKHVAGRTLYLSIFGIEEKSVWVSECRIHDLLGDGISENPIASRDIGKIVQHRLGKKRGPFGSDRYRWEATQGTISEIDIHFGFDGWGISPFSKEVRKFDPYAPYGLTIVAGSHRAIVVN